MGTVIVVLAGSFLLSRLPGTGGVGGELHWMLAQAASPQDRNRAFLLLYEAESRKPGARVELLRQLLSDSNPRVRSGALVAAVDTIRVTRTIAGVALSADDGLDLALRDWWQAADVREQIARLPHSFVAWVLSRPYQIDDTADRWGNLKRAARDQALSSAERRWLLAATLQRADPPRSLIDELVFQGPAAGEIGLALRFLDGLESRMPAAIVGRPPSWNWDPERDRLPWSFAELHIALDDPVREVRWAAARILSVSGDARGLPVLSDWLRSNSRYAGPAAELMEVVFGVRWRELCESSSTTRDAGQRNGR